MLRSVAGKKCVNALDKTTRKYSKGDGKERVILHFTTQEMPKAASPLRLAAFVLRDKMKAINLNLTKEDFL